MSVQSRSKAPMAFFAVFLFAQAHAQSLPDTQLTIMGTGVTGTYADGIASLSIDGYGPNFPGDNSGNASLTYTFEIVGPNNTTVPVEFFANGNVSGNNDKTAVTVSAALGSNVPLAACSFSQFSCPGLSGPSLVPASFAGPFIYHVPTNTPITIAVIASWISGCCGDGTFGGGNAVGSVTTRIAIDSQWMRRGYAIFYSSDANPNPVSLLDTLQSEISRVHPEGLEDKATDAQNDLQQSCVSLGRLIRDAKSRDGKALSAQLSQQIVSSALVIEALIGCH